MKADYSVEIKTKPLTDQEHYEADVHLKLNDEGYALDSVADEGGTGQVQGVLERFEAMLQYQATS